MAVKVVKVIQLVGSATEGGVTFTASEIMHQAHAAFQAAIRKAVQEGGVTTSPAKIKVLVEQEVIVND